MKQIWFGILFTAVFPVWGWGAPVKVAATIAPLADMARQVGGEAVQVTTLLPAGANPHAFELTPAGIQMLQGVRIIFAVGRGLDDWVQVVGDSLPSAKIVRVDDDIPRLGGGNPDPHYWLSLANARIIAANMARALGGNGAVGANLKRYQEELQKADQEIKNMLAVLPTRKIVTVHPGWSYFARDYGFEIIGSLEPAHGEPTPRRLARLAKQVQAEGVKTIFSEPGIPKEIGESFAQDARLSIYELDPVGGASGEANYVNLMIQNARIIKEALTLSHG